MISDSFRGENRALAQASFASGMLLGGAAGVALGGIMGEHHSWQRAFIIVGALGILPGLLALKLKEPPRRPRSEVVALRELLSVPAYLAMIAAGTCITFSSVSLVAWGYDYARSYKDLSTKEAAIFLSVIPLLALVPGALTGGYLADRLRKRYSYGRPLVIAGGFLIAAPFLLLAIQAEEKWVFLGGFFVACFFMSWYHGPVTAGVPPFSPPRPPPTPLLGYT